MFKTVYVCYWFLSDERLKNAITGAEIHLTTLEGIKYCFLWLYFIVLTRTPTIKSDIIKAKSVREFYKEIFQVEVSSKINFVFLKMYTLCQNSSALADMFYKPGIFDACSKQSVSFFARKILPTSEKTTPREKPE